MRRLSQAQLAAEAARAARYLTVGGAGLALDAAVFTLVSHFGQGRAVARAVSLAAATCLTWAINRRVTFARTGRKRREELMRYAAVALCAQATNYTLFLVVGALAPSLHPLVLIPCCAAVSASISYTGQRLFTFRPATSATL